MQFSHRTMSSTACVCPWIATPARWSLLLTKLRKSLHHAQCKHSVVERSKNLRYDHDCSMMLISCMNMPSCYSCRSLLASWLYHARSPALMDFQCTHHVHIARKSARRFVKGYLKLHFVAYLHDYRTPWHAPISIAAAKTGASALQWMYHYRICPVLRSIEFASLRYVVVCSLMLKIYSKVDDSI